MNPVNLRKIFVKWYLNNMKIKKIIIYKLLQFFSFFIKLMPIKRNRISFISLDSTELTLDYKLLYDELIMDSSLDIKLVLFNYSQKSLKNDFLYFINTFIQLYYSFTSKVVLLNNNNYVISNFKRQGVNVIQIWHACGAIKKFGNDVERQYKITNYDYVISCSSFWQDIYATSFNVTKDKVVVTGMPRLDLLFKSSGEDLYKKYPQLKNKKVVLYAPTFRGNIITGVSNPDVNLDLIINELPDNYIMVTKFHPLVNSSFSHERIIDLTNYSLYDIFNISDLLISDYSSIVFDYSLLNKPIIFYLSDYDLYKETIGFNVDKNLLPGHICYNEKELIKLIQQDLVVKSSNDFIKYKDADNTTRVVKLIGSVFNEE